MQCAIKKSKECFHNNVDVVEKVQTVYDGVAILKTSKRISPNKENEQKCGIAAMLPDWCDEINRGKTIENLYKWIMSVRDRQKVYISRFPSHNESPHQDKEHRTKTAEGRVDQVL